MGPDEAEAMDSYASKDETLRKLADRIQARAIRRYGELLKQIEPKRRGQPSHGGTRTSRDSPGVAICMCCYARWCFYQRTDASNPRTTRGKLRPQSSHGGGIRAGG